ncbi:actin-related protein 8 [Sipha flava]|uniref:Actin-related protein 8 n=1 Tax=Sipha flava TaxID=143950 RepID=A0A8B8FST1_9HEMI|nr:actin-related protein 8 [Sipha flava]
MPNAGGENHPEPERTTSNSVIVIHPGSLYLRIGRASDVAPHKYIHGLARSSLLGEVVREDRILPTFPYKNPETLAIMEENRLQASHMLQSSLQSNGDRRYATPPQQISAFNRNAVPQYKDTAPHSYAPEADIIYGEDIFNIDPEKVYNIFFPISNGELNVNGQIGGSLTAVLGDLETIWTHCINKLLDIKTSEFHNYKVILIIPDIFNRVHVREMMSMILLSMKFKACILIQDHVAATYGAGLGFACVVDVGHSKTSVSCVEDGISQTSTRIRLRYGGANITQTFHWLLKKCSFPYHECNPMTSHYDAILLDSLKQKFCHLNLDKCGAVQKTVTVMKPAKKQVQYIIQVGDEAMIAVLGMFNPTLLGITDNNHYVIQEGSKSLPEDPYDEEFLRETSRRGTGREMETETQADNSIAHNTEDELCVDQIETAGNYFEIETGRPQSLDKVIVQSIERLNSDDIKRKMYSSILVVGGGLKFEGACAWLKSKISLNAQQVYYGGHIEIINSPKDLDPQIVTWKGAAILAGLESSNELWITGKEWSSWSVRILKERAMFNW